MKKLFIISATLLLVVLIFLGVYNFAFKQNSGVELKSANPIASEVSKVILSENKEKITPISDGAVLGAVVNKKTEKIRYYELATGFVWESSSDGKEKQQVTSTKVAGLKNVSWSPDRNMVLTMAEKEEKTFFYLYDHVSKKSTLLKDGLDNVVWDNIGTKIFYKYFNADTKEKTLNVSNPDGSDWQKIADVADRNLSISAVPLTSTVSFWNFPNAKEETKLRIVGVTGGEIKTILSDKYGADYLWSPKGDKALVSSLQNKDSKSVMLGIVSIDGKYQDLNIPTFVSKCVWAEDNKTLYYALPGEMPFDAVMPDDYQNNKFNTSDTFWKMDIATGEKERIIEAVDIKEKYDSSSLFLSATEDALYFINKRDHKLYRISL
ncbi:MAG: hypothetical protein US25_C0084G0002 [Candidatus Moranbacteria bacterium GW2011_GWE1_36_7]|nr:MAG: hypothetical protein UR99_C0015G0026 [Candidatus Moranbacteria bacterium GW2011_GWD2_36_12]KKQ06391.1 MAG: hypothetical protein US16_C0018G0025 [Candidatus Moranbacteria bacterium GW2011_GWE2_36_40]KKQ11463.1 MAG: hypothetical protein US25_C0084G0002 [Candidatus Moranbacteria bacterium GW2011_GWE1_36_7]